ncbi:MAG: FkbM family methyltransferase [Rhodoblastus sp.]|nr:FkbM family methyltransferase [Rhodoblastus sp.]
MSDIRKKLFDLEAREGCFERIIERLYRAWVCAGDTVIDGGANVGRHSVPLSEAVGASGTVISVEPIPALANRLRASLPPNCKVLQSALSNESGVGEFYFVKNDPAYSGLQRRDYPFAVLDIDQISVPKIKIDDLEAELSKLTLIKLDLEGGEFRAIQGGFDTIKKTRPLVIFENGREKPAKTYGYTKEEFFNTFNEMDYLIFDLFGDNFTLKEWEKPAVPWNYIAQPRGGRDIKNILDNILGSFIH